MHLPFRSPQIMRRNYAEDAAALQAIDSLLVPLVGMAAGSPRAAPPGCERARAALESISYSPAEWRSELGLQVKLDGKRRTATEMLQRFTAAPNFLTLDKLADAIERAAQRAQQEPHIIFSGRRKRQERRARRAEAVEPARWRRSWRKKQRGRTRRRMR